MKTADNIRIGRKEEKIHYVTEEERYDGKT